jgi:hypothetical protein
MTGFGTEFRNRNKVRRRAILKQKIAFVTMLLLRVGEAPFIVRTPQKGK